LRGAAPTAAARPGSSSSTWRGTQHAVMPAVELLPCFNSTQACRCPVRPGGRLCARRMAERSPGAAARRSSLWLAEWQHFQSVSPAHTASHEADLLASAMHGAVTTGSCLCKQPTASATAAQTRPLSLRPQQARQRPAVSTASAPNGSRAVCRPGLCSAQCSATYSHSYHVKAWARVSAWARCTPQRPSAGGAQHLHALQVPRQGQLVRCPRLSPHRHSFQKSGAAAAHSPGAHVEDAGRRRAPAI